MTKRAHFGTLGAVAAFLGIGLSGGCGAQSPQTATAATGPLEGARSVSAVTSIGPLPLDASVEKTVCIYRRLDNAEALTATTIQATLAKGSHHLIVYRASKTEEDLTPKRCEPFGGIVTGEEVPIAIIATADYRFSFPKGVGIPLGAKQMLKLEAHYINASTKPIEGRGTVTFEGAETKQATTLQQADIGFWGTTKIKVPAQASFDTGAKFQSGIAGTKVFAVGTHQHRYGTRFRVWTSPSANDSDLAPSTAPVVDETNWAEPRLMPVDPPYAFDGSNGLAYDCEWKNTGSEPAFFGESALNEMCFVFAYYYPSQGFDLCIDGHCLRRK
ncbi:MAG: hypothetical protein NVS3B20_01220 [Polyangiales bacterium]